eukprot:7781763-Prorocentrum_lima.AAC.1
MSLRPVLQKRPHGLFCRSALTACSAEITLQPFLQKCPHGRFCRSALAAGSAEVFSQDQFC